MQEILPWKENKSSGDGFIKGLEKMPNSNFKKIKAGLNIVVVVQVIDMGGALGDFRLPADKS